MGPVTTPFNSDQEPCLSLFTPGAVFADPDGDADASSLCLSCKGVNTNDLYYSLLPWTSQTRIFDTAMNGSPAGCASDEQNFWVWKNAEGTGMSWCSNALVGVQPVPNHAHTDSSPAIIFVDSAIDPDTGTTDFNLFTLFWKGDAQEGGQGSTHELWSMASQGPFGWADPVRIHGAFPAGSPSVTAGAQNGTWSITLAWVDFVGQIWLTQSSNDSGDADTAWATPTPGPTTSRSNGRESHFFMASFSSPGLSPSQARSCMRCRSLLTRPTA